MPNVLRVFAGVGACMVWLVIADCGGLATAGGDGGVDTAGDGRREIGRDDAHSDAGDTHTQWINYCAIMGACGLSYEFEPGVVTLPDGGPELNLMTECVALQLANTVNPTALPVPQSSPGDRFWMNCVLAGGANCASARACTNGGDPNDTCDADTFQSLACEGTTERWCDRKHRWATDCSNIGATCVPGVGCVTGPCKPYMVSDFGACKGDTQGYCAKAFGVDAGTADASPEYFTVKSFCKELGGSACSMATYTTAPDATFHVAQCEGPGTPCSADRCDGSTLVACVGGREARFDCAPSGLGCYSRADAGFDRLSSVNFGANDAGIEVSPVINAYCGLGTECAIDFPDSCNGNVLTYCDVGKIAKLDCVAAGWKACVSDKSGTRCSP